MLPPPDLIRRYTSIDVPQRLHLESLMASWSLLADLSFSDLLLFAPVTKDTGEEVATGVEASGLGVRASTRLRRLRASSLDEAAAAGLGRPRPAPSWCWDRSAPPRARPFTRATSSDRFSLSRPCSTWSRPTKQVSSSEPSSRARSATGSCASPTFPCVTGARSSACSVVSGHLGRPGAGARSERVYLELFERLSVMVADGLFPFVDDEAAVEEAPRVGDGVMVIDARERITFASPNAVNALHRASITSAIVGSSLATLGLETSAIDEAFANKLPAIEEVERRPDVMLMVRCIPLIAQGRGHRGGDLASRCDRPAPPGPALVDQGRHHSRGPPPG